MQRKIRVEERTERRISTALAIAMCAFVVLVEITVSILLSAYLRATATIFYGLLELLASVIAVWIYTRPGSPSYKLSWMCLILLLPVAGMFLFYMWGGAQQSKTLSMKRVPIPRASPEQERASGKNITALGKCSPVWERLAIYLQKRGFLLYRDTAAQYFRDGTAYFDDLIQHLENAKRYIFLEYYIVAEGRIWDRIFRILKDRVSVGVEVRIIFDDFGNLSRFTGQSLQALRNAGIAVMVFNPVHKYINRIYFNFRDHRKIAVIDGQYAYTGGINIGDEYANLVERFGYWKDSSIRIDGSGAWGFAAQFIQMWKSLGGVLSREIAFYRFQADANESTDSAPIGWCQPFTDGPAYNPDNPIEETYLQLISSAQRTLYITTPYYAVEQSMQQALCIAADAGVDVCLMMPAIPDHKAVYMVAETYWGELLRHGVRVYKYTPGFLHAKSVMVDGETALIGSTNMDYRTFQLHYECGVLMYHMPAVKALQEDMESIMAVSHDYSLKEWNARPWYRRAAASILKLGAIWL